MPFFPEATRWIHLIFRDWGTNQIEWKALFTCVVVIVLIHQALNINLFLSWVNQKHLCLSSLFCTFPQAVGIVGAVIMPHNMYLHSALVKVSARMYKVGWMHSELWHVRETIDHGQNWLEHSSWVFQEVNSKDKCIAEWYYNMLFNSLLATNLFPSCSPFQ